MGREVPGQTGMGCPIVPLSRDKEIFLSQCPFVPGQGQEQKSQDKMNFYLSNCTKKFSEKMTRFPVLECHFPV